MVLRLPSPRGSRVSNLEETSVDLFAPQRTIAVSMATSPHTGSWPIHPILHGALASAPNSIWPRQVHSLDLPMTSNLL